MRTVKCVVWDLDNTVWHGVLLEDRDVRLRNGIREIIDTLDGRGILHSIASRNDRDTALAKLGEFGLAHYFLAPQINWNPKSDSVDAIRKQLNIGVDALAFVDDEPYERHEVAFSHPEVLCLAPQEIDTLLDRPELNPAIITEEARGRRLLYQAEQSRHNAEAEFTGPKEEFLASLGMRLSLRRAEERDLLRAEELTVRTNQLNTTGRTYSHAELDALRTSDRHLLLVAELTDRFGPYGTIGLALVAQDKSDWTIKLFLMSCRVAARGIGVVLLSHIRRLARAEGARLLAEFVPTDRNRMMYATYKFNRFTETSRTDDLVILEADPAAIPADPPYVRVIR